MNDSRLQSAAAISVVILTRNRWAELHKTLTHLVGQSEQILELIVVDNASTDGTAAMIQSTWPDVRVVRNYENRGIAGWNDGVAMATGKYALLLDDDCYPEVDAMGKVVAFLQTQNDVAIVGLRVYEGLERQLITKCYEVWPRSFSGCACVVRTEVFLAEGGFLDRLLVYNHEVEFSLRVRNAGWRIAHLTDAVAYHRYVHPWQAKSQRYGTRVYYDTRNILLILLLRFPLRRVAFRGLRLFLGRLTFGILHGCAAAAVRGLWDVLRSLPGIFKERSVLREVVQQEYSFGSFFGGYFFATDIYALERPAWLKLQFTNRAYRSPNVVHE